MKQRLIRVLGRYGILLAVGLVYYIFVALTNVGIPCVFRLITGLQCPGCGVSRMLMALSRFDFISAFHYNPAVLLTAPAILFCILRSDIDYIRTGKNSQNQYPLIWMASLVILLVFGVIRNIV